MHSNEIPSGLDWTKLPPDLRYIAPFAEKYGPWAYDIERNLKKIKQRMKELEDVAVEIGFKNHHMRFANYHFIGPHDAELEIDLVHAFLSMIDQLGLPTSDFGPMEHSQVLALWDRLHYKLWERLVPQTMSVLGDDTFDFVADALNRLPKKARNEIAPRLLLPLRSAKSLSWIEQNVPNHVLPTSWACLASVSQLDWPTVCSWLDRGMPLSLVALDALSNMGQLSDFPLVKAANPRLLNPPSRAIAEVKLKEVVTADSSPRCMKATIKIIENWRQIAGLSSDA